MCDILLAHGADVNNATEGHYTPYSHALNSCSKGIGCTQQILDLLKRYGAELATESKVGRFEKRIYIALPELDPRLMPIQLEEPHCSSQYRFWYSLFYEGVFSVFSFSFLGSDLLDLMPFQLHLLSL